jgi:tetratricopeptide (TPR) repeat protein
VNEDETIKNALAGNVLLYIKTPDITGFTDENKVYLYPTFLVLNSEGEALYTWIGWPGSEEWAKRLSMATADPISVEARRARFNTSPTFKDAYMLGNIEYARRNTRGGHEYFRRAMELDGASARSEGVPILLFNTAFRGVGSGDFTVEECAAVGVEIMSDDQARTEDVLRITERLVGAIKDIGDEAVIPFLEMAYPIVEKDTSEELYARRQRFYGNYAMIVEKDPPTAVGFKKEAMPEGWMESPRQLNSFAWWCFENKVNLEEAEELSRRSVELAGDPGLKANCLDTLAELVNLRGDTAGALDLINQGLEIDPDNEYLQKQRARFEEEVALAS